MFYKNLPVSGFEPQTSGIRSDRSANWSTTTAPTMLATICVSFFQSKCFISGSFMKKIIKYSGSDWAGHKVLLLLIERL